MLDFTTLKDNLEHLGYKVSVFNTKEEALSYLDNELDNKSIGFGGSETVMEMGLYDALSTHNRCTSHHKIKEGETPDMLRKRAMNTDIYISSCNAIALSGEIINIDGRGNRVASLTFGHEKVIIIAGENKVEENFEKALWRARNTASPKNAIRVKANTPCAVKGDKCYDCSSADRICNALLVLWHKPMGMDYEIVLIHENLGY